jgi:methyl-accepting chemotaxis protein
MKTMQNTSSRLEKLGIGTKLGLAFATVLLFTAVLGGAALLALDRVNSEAKTLATKWLPAVGDLATARAFLLEFRELEVKHTRAADASYMAEYEEKLGPALQAANKSIANYTARPLVSDETALLATLTKSLTEYLDFHKKIIAMGRAGKQDDARDVSDGASKAHLDDAISALDKLSAFGFTTAQVTADDIDTVYRNAQMIVLGLIAITLLVSTTLAVLFTRSLLRQLGGQPHIAAALVRAVAEGDLTTRLTVRRGDTTSLMARLIDMQSRLSSVVGAVRQNAESVATASAEIAQGNHDLSVRTEQQASALQQTASTAADLDQIVKTNAENATLANQLARGASEVAERGGKVVGEVVGTMQGINDSARKIADIIGVIDGIAFQTNILALNAAVEAARAGEQGRGFAVVASEVRSLAGRSAEAAKEIKGLINSSVERVERGTVLVDQAGATMTEVVDAIRKAGDVVAEITAASAQQSQSVALVSESVAQMDITTQQNAALVEQSAAAAESLRQQADSLVKAVAVFRLDRP